MQSTRHPTCQLYCHQRLSHLIYSKWTKSFKHLKQQDLESFGLTWARALLHHGRQRPPAEEQQRQYRERQEQGRMLAQSWSFKAPVFQRSSSIFLSEVIDRSNGCESLLCHLTYLTFCIGCYLKRLMLQHFFFWVHKSPSEIILGGWIQIRKCLWSEWLYRFVWGVGIF